MSASKKKDFKKEIIDLLKKNPYGLTISVIAKELKMSRNTAYRYLGILEAEKTIFTKVIGNFILYFSKEKGMYFLENTIPIYKRLMFNLKKEFSNQEITFKRIGRDLGDFIDIPSDAKSIEQAKSLKEIPSRKALEIIGKMIRHFTLIDNKVSVKIIEMSEEYNKATYIVSNSIMLSNNMDYLYHFIIITGVIEEKLKNILNRDIKCEFLNFQILEKPEDSFFKISVEII